MNTLSAPLPADGPASSPRKLLSAAGLRSSGAALRILAATSRSGPRAGFLGELCVAVMFMSTSGPESGIPGTRLPFFAAPGLRIGDNRLEDPTARGARAGCNGFLSNVDADTELILLESTRRPFFWAVFAPELRAPLPVPEGAPLEPLERPMGGESPPGRRLLRTPAPPRGPSLTSSSS